MKPNTETPNTQAIVNNLNNQSSELEPSSLGLKEVLKRIGSTMPKTMVVLEDHEGPTEWVKKSRQFEFGTVKDNIANLVFAIAHNQDDIKDLEQQFANIYGKALKGLSLPTKHGQQAWRHSHDNEPALMLDAFFVNFPQKMQRAIEGKSNSRELVQNVLEIVATALARIPSGEEKRDFQTASSIKNFYDIPRACTTGEDFAQYIEGGTEEAAAEKLRFISIIRLAQEESQEMGPRDIKLYSDRASLIALAQEILDHHPGSLEALDNYVLRLADNQPQLFVDIKEKSMIGIANAVKDIVNLTAVPPQDVIAEIEKQTFETANKDLVAATMFIMHAFSALAKATKLREYSLDQAQQFLALTSDYFCATSNDRDLVDNFSLHTTALGFVNDGLIDYLMDISVEGFAQEVINDSRHSGDREEAIWQIKKVRRAVNTLVVFQVMAEMSGTTLESNELVDLYHQIMGFNQLPQGVIDLRQNFLVGCLENIHPANNGREHFFALFEKRFDRDEMRLFTTDFSLRAISRDEFLASLTFEIGLQQDPQIFPYFVEGLGILSNAMRDKLNNREFADYFPHSDEDRQKEALFVSIANLAKIYHQADTKAEKDHLDELFVYILQNRELCVPFFVHLHQSGNLETLQSLSWVTRLADTDKDDNRVIGLKSKTDQSLARMLIDPRFVLLSSDEELKPQISDPTMDNSRNSHGNSTLAKRVDVTTPLGCAINIIAATDNSSETTRQIVDALSKVDLRSIEDAKALSESIITAFIKYLNLDSVFLREQMFTFQSGEELIGEIGQVNPVAGTIAAIGAVLGIGTMPSLAYSPKQNSIVITENSLNGYTIDALGEEIMHWVRHIMGNQEDENPIVQEFWGFIGRRIARSALGASDTKVTIENYEKMMLVVVENFLDVEYFHALDIGYQNQLRSIFLHTIGYLAGSNVDIKNLAGGLIEQSDDYLLKNFIKTYGPNQQWFKRVVKKITGFYREYAKEKGIEKTTLNDVLQPIVEVLNLLPYIDQEQLIA